MKSFLKIINNDRHQNNGKDRRKNTDRRNGADRRQNGQALDTSLIFEQDVVFNTKEACDYLKISRPTYLKYISAGKIKAEKVGRGWKTLKSELDKLLIGS